MADQDLEIRVRTTADTAALDQVESKIKNLGGALGGAGAIDDPSVLLRQKYPELFEPPGAPFGGGGGAGYAGLTAAAADADRVAQAAKVAGTNFFSVATHATILARGLASGHLELRAMTVLANQLSGEYLAAAGAVGAIGGALLLAVKDAQKQVEEAQELGKQYDELIKKAHEFSEAAASSRTGEDVSKSLQSALAEADKIGAKLKELQEADLPWWKSAIDAIDKATGAVEEYRTALDKQISDQQTLKEKADALAFSTLKQAEGYKAAFDALKSKDSVTAIQDVSEKIANLTKEQSGLNTKTSEGQHRWVELSKEIKQATADLDQLQKIQEKRYDDLGKATDASDANVQAVLRNEKASRDARATGQGKDAEMYQASADAFKNSLNPAQLQQLDNIRKLQDATGDLRDQATKPLPGGGPVAGIGESQALVNQIEENKRRFEKQNEAIDQAQAKQTSTEGEGLISERMKREFEQELPPEPSPDWQTGAAKIRDPRQSQMSIGIEQKLDELLSYFKQTWGF